MKERDTYTIRQSVYNRIERDENGQEKVIPGTVYEERQVLAEYKNICVPKRYWFNNGGFSTIFHNVSFAIAMDKSFKKVEFRLLHFLISTSGVDGSINTDLDTIAEALEISKPMASMALKGLVQRNIVIRKDHSRYDRSPIQNIPYANYDQINYRLAYNSKTKDFSDKKYKHPEIEIPCGDHLWMNIETGEVTKD